MAISEDSEASAGGTNFQNGLSQLRAKTQEMTPVMRKLRGYTSQVTPGDWNSKDKIDGSLA